jgi:hypothetical protein
MLAHRFGESGIWLLEVGYLTKRRRDDPMYG